MNGKIEKLNIKGYECLIYLPPEYELQELKYPVVYINGGDKINEIMENIEPHFGYECEKFILVSVHSTNWNDEYSPWPAPALMKNEIPFGGGAENYLSFLEKNIKPFIDKKFKTKSDTENTALIGYSLGGLAALYALYKCKCFGKIGSLSGSLWFDAWTEFMSVNIPLNLESKVYLSLGKGEENIRNQRMSKVGECTKAAYDLLQKQLKKTENSVLEWNNGGHFTEVPQRYVKAITWLMKLKED